MTQRRRDEAGAVAVMFAMMMTLLFVMGAMTVDLGNAFMEKRERQKDTDLATLAGAGIAGANLPVTSAATCNSASYAGPKASSADAAVKDTALNLASQLATPTVTAATLAAGYLVDWTDCDATDGEIVYGLPVRGSTGKYTATLNKNQLSLISPPKHVDYGFAKIIGASGNDVHGVSTVEIRSPKFSTLPFYAFTGCDYGPQTLQQPNNGNSADPIMLFAPTDTNAGRLTSVTPNAYPAGTLPGTLQPIDVVLSAPATLTGITEVGFFETGNAVMGPPPVTTTAFTVSGSTIHLNDLPDQTRGVTGVQQFWYIRVKIGGTWSDVYVGNGPNPTLNAPKLTIGNPPLLCGQGSSSGNFGTLLLSNHVGGGADKMGAANVALGLDSTLAIYPVADRLADGTCNSGQTSTVLWTAEGTNCVDTDTGMSANVATGGFLGIGSSSPGTGLLAKSFTTRCGPGGSAATTIIKGVTVNNDPLTCFFTNPSVHISDIDNGAYAGPPVLSAEIYDSPRFGYVPVLPIQPANGGSKKYQIIEFRPCFITDQAPSSVKGDSNGTTTGIITDNNGVKAVTVIFINDKALPNPPIVNGTLVYTGTGPKIPLLVN